MFRRSIGTFERRRRVRSRPPTMIRPRVGSSSFSMSRTIVDFPDPDAPTTKTNSPFSITNVTSRRAVTSGSYTFVTDSNTIIALGVGVAGVELGPVGLDQLGGVEDVGADLAPEADVLGGAPLAGELGLPLLLRQLGQAGAEDSHCRLLVRGLRALVLDADDDPCREVGDPDGGVGLVHVLAAGAACAVCIDPEVTLVELDRGVVGEGRADDHLRERRVAPVRLVERAEADEPVDTPLRLEDRARVVVVVERPLVAVERAGDARVCGRDPRRALLIVPEAGLAHLLFELCAARAQRIRVKGNHGPTRGGSRSPRAAAPRIARS